MKQKSLRFFSDNSALKDIFHMLQGPELSDFIPAVAHHVADDLRLEGVTPITNLQL